MRFKSGFYKPASRFASSSAIAQMNDVNDDNNKKQTLWQCWEMSKWNCLWTFDGIQTFKPKT